MAARSRATAPRTVPVLAPIEHITQAILVFRGHKVLLDAELAALYGVTTKRLNEQVKRNLERFPKDFLFRLSAAEVEALNRSHFATGSQKHRDPRFPPYAFTEHGAIMAAMVLNSPRAVEMSVYVVRAFVQLREPLSSNRELARRLVCPELGQVRCAGPNRDRQQAPWRPCSWISSPKLLTRHRRHRQLVGTHRRHRS